MLPLFLPVDLPCAEAPVLNVRVPAGGHFGWPGMPAARAYDTDHGWRGPSHEETAKDGLLRCPALPPGEPGLDICEYDIPVPNGPPDRVNAWGAGRIVFATYRCSPFAGQPRVFWTLPDGDLLPGVQYALPDPAPEVPLDAPADDVAAARTALEAARALLGRCSDTRCGEAVSTRKKALDAALAAPWTLTETGAYLEARGPRRTGVRARFATPLAWATVERVCYSGEHGDCETTLRFYDSPLLVYSYDGEGGDTVVWWNTGSADLSQEYGLLGIRGDAVRLRPRQPGQHP